MKMVIYILFAVIVLTLLAGQLGFLNGKQPSSLGVKDERLKQPSFSPNSVSSQADLYPDHPQLQYARIEPLPLKDGNLATSMTKLADVLRSLPSTAIVETKPDYIYAQSQTRLLKFVDDVEFWFNPAKGAIEVRSSSRLGRKDFGVNRQRIELVRQKYMEN
ncbi:MAG: DUF1499 domain-containing protein [Polaromonas sp.]|jgi:uncharacterized protein (DUF1499 family)|nr:DUF1499 domain-containing protein [Polaromonas sp.]MBP8874596.1 DUF1499 domain-containing protein [Polaromonas sp.]MBP9056869.1 DUF1499 domain-containing protein [Polaromonas sp.]MBP9831257.1 DUF1499 domain-containing protein [Polaromonas sp.]